MLLHHKTREDVAETRLASFSDNVGTLEEIASTVQYGTKQK